MIWKCAQVGKWWVWWTNLASKSPCLGKDENTKDVEEAKEQVENAQVVNKKESRSEGSSFQSLQPIHFNKSLQSS